MSRIDRPDAQWKAEPGAEALPVLRHEGTERANPGTLLIQSSDGSPNHLHLRCRIGERE